MYKDLIGELFRCVTMNNWNQILSTVFLTNVRDKNQQMEQEIKNSLKYRVLKYVIN